MNLKESIYAYLSTFAGLTALVNSKIYPVMIPQNAQLPVVVYRKIDSGYAKSAVGGNDGFVQPVYQFSVDALTYANCDAIIEQLKAALVNYQDTMGGAGGVEVQGVFLINETDIYRSGDGIEKYTAELEFEFNYTL